MPGTDFQDALYEKYAADAEKSIYLLPERMQHVMCILLVHYPICNGGFRHLFECDLSGGVDYDLVVRSFEKVGLPHIAQSFRVVLTLFPEGAPPRDMGAREEYLMRYFTEQDEDGDNIESYSSVVDDSEIHYFSEKNNILKALEAYCESHCA